MAFPYGQLGVILPVAISLALFANINIGFAQPQAQSKPSGEFLFLPISGCMS